MLDAGFQINEMNLSAIRQPISMIIPLEAIDIKFYNKRK
jgi:hypothetical protein